MASRQPQSAMPGKSISREGAKTRRKLIFLVSSRLRVSLCSSGCGLAPLRASASPREMGSLLLAIAVWLVGGGVALSPAIAADPATSQAVSRPTPAPLLRVAWRYAMPKPTDAILSADDQLVVAGDRGGNVVALGAADGKLAWQVKVKAAVTSAPLITPDRVYLGDEEGTLHALSRADGKELWTFKAAGKIVGRPTLAGDRLLVGAYDNHIFCLNAADGAELWRFKSGAQVHASVVVAGELAISGGCDGQLRALSLVDGQERWTLDAGGPIATTPMVSRGRIAIGTMAGEILACDPSGKTLWRLKPAEQRSYTVSPAVQGEVVAFGSDDGELSLLRIDDGRSLGAATLGGKSPLVPLAGCWAAGTEDGRVLILDRQGRGVLGKATLGGTILSLAPSGRGLIAGTAEGVIWGLFDKAK